MVPWGKARSFRRTINRDILPDMNKLLEFGRKAMFIVRVFSGYEERRIRAHRLLLQERLVKAQARKAELRKLPEQVILSEVRRMVEQMQALNRKLDETETAIEEYFKPLDKNAQAIINMQLDREEKHMKEMMKIAQEQAMHQKEAAQRESQLHSVDLNHQTESGESPLQQEQQAK